MPSRRASWSIVLSVTAAVAGAAAFLAPAAGEGPATATAPAAKPEITPVTVTPDLAHDMFLHTGTRDVSVDMLIPKEHKVVRGFMLAVANYRADPDDRFYHMARTKGFGVVVLNHISKATNRPNLFRTALTKTMPGLAEASGHPELPNVPFFGIGHSAGGMAVQTLDPWPDRAAGNIVDCAWVADTKKTPEPFLHVPYLTSIGSNNDGFNMLPGVEGNYPPSREMDLPWTVVLKWGTAHDYATAGVLWASWPQPIIDLRIPKDADPLAGPVKLTPIDTTKTGYIGDRTTWGDSDWPTVVPVAEYKGEKKNGVWLPDRSFAYVWRAIMVKDPAVALAATAGTGEKFKPYGPKVGKSMTINPGTDVTLAPEFPDAEKKPALAKVVYFDGDQQIGEGAGGDFSFVWKAPAPGAHAVWARWETGDGKPHAAPPGAVFVRSFASEKKAAIPKD